MKPRWIAVVVAVAAAGTTVSGCGGGVADGAVEIRVLVASSLAPAFERIADAYEAAHPGVSVVPTAAGSATLATQVEQGLGFDVAALADEETMARLVKGGHVPADSVAVFATNTLAIVVPEGNPRGIGALADLGRTGLRLALCDPVQPCGRYTARVLDRAGVELSATTTESSAGAVAGRVGRGEADAGISYATEDRVPGVDTVSIPGRFNVTARYPIGIGNDALSDAEPALGFVAYVVSGPGRRILAEEGFGAP